MSKASKWVADRDAINVAKPEGFQSHGITASLEVNGKVWIHFFGNYGDEDLATLGHWLIKTFGDE
jgi:hypothetical protein